MSEITEREVQQVAVAAEMVDVLSRWAMAMFQSGISPVKDSHDPMEAITFDTQEVLFKATGGDVVASTLERQCAFQWNEGGNR